MREHMVAVKAKGGGSVVHCASNYAIKLKPGETATKWEDGSPITRADFDAILAPTGEFEIVVPAEASTKAKDVAAQPAVKAAAEKAEV